MPEKTRDIWDKGRVSALPLLSKISVYIRWPPSSSLLSDIHVLV